MTTKMKGLLKGLRYISQIFDNEEEEPEMMIGYPTDVKHVAHIGWDGPAVNSPSWMNEFKSPPSSSSSALPETQGDQEGSSGHGQQDSSRSGSRIEGTSQNPPEIPKSSRRHGSAASGGGGGGVDPESSSRKGKSSRSSRSSRVPKGASSPARSDVSNSEPSSPTLGGVESPVKNSILVPDIPKKSRRKKSKESSLGNSNKSSSNKSKQSSSSFSDSGSVSSVKDHAPPSN